jgi:FtsZ-binding cell division protein ZapB
LAAIMLVAGCFQVNVPDVPDGPYVNLGGQPRQPTAAERTKVHGMDKQAMEDEVLRLTGENDGLRLENEKLKRDNKMLKAERDHYKDTAENLQDQIKDLRKR